jgi:hypothetical protein
MTAGSGCFLVGAAIAVPRVFTERDPQRRLQLLEAHPTAWRLGQPLYALGAMAAAGGVGALATEALSTSSGWLAASCASLVLGALAWGWSVYLRTRRPRDFALGRLPGWPFIAYVWLTLIGLSLLGVGLLAGSWPAWAGWATLAADAVFLAVFLRTGDIPPFVFYVLLGIVGGFAVL